jgi:NAD(P)-dependent dehydrogenase (short-subunit alcohol dehydrogenase family)
MTLDPLAGFRLDGRVALVTGASSGLGARFARVLDAAGAKVVLVARRLDRLEALAAELHDAHAVRCDLTRDDELDRPVDAALERYGRVDVLVNNAGGIDTGAALEEPLARFQDVIAINLVAPFALAQRAARAMVASGEGGSIVNIASVLGLVGSGTIPQAGYAASKGGIVNLTRELAAQWARHGIRVNALAPGWFETEMTAEMLSGERGREWVARRTPMARHGREGELDGALLFLAAPASAYVTGQVLAVDGGWTSI